MGKPKPPGYWTIERITKKANKHKIKVISKEFFGKLYSEAEFFPYTMLGGCFIVNIEYVNGIFFIS